MPEKEDEFLATARKRFSAAAEEEKELRSAFADDLRFASPDGEGQWDEQIAQQRKAANRPTLSFPRCHTFVQQVSNEARENKPQIKYAPANDEQKDTADVIEGIARKIQYDSQAQVAYETAIEYSAGASFGYYRILTDYCDYDSDDQEIKIVPVYDPMSVYGVLMPAIYGRQPRWWFVVEDMPKDEYTAQYGDKFKDSSLSWEDAGKKSDGWINADSVRIAEYWYIAPPKKEKGDDESGEDGKSAKNNKRVKPVIKWCKTNGLEILEETTWVGTQCNVIPVLGKQMIINGKPKLFSVIRPQKAAQQLINYSKSRIAETLAQAPVSPWIAEEGQLEGYEAQWKSSNSTPQAVLFYKGTSASGTPAPPPQRQVYEPPIAALSAFVNQEVDDMKATTGIFDASMGSQSNETSGQAIARRQQQANTNNLHFMDNLARSFKQGGDVIAELIPKIYDAEREITILGENEAQKIVMINKPTRDASGKLVHHDIANFKGKYVVTMGKAYGSKRAESFDTISQVVQTSPQMFPVVGDIMFRNSDMAGADELAERLHKMLPPNLQDDEQNQLPPQAQAAMAQAQQQAQMMQGEIQKMMMERQGKVIEHQGKIQQIEAQHQADMELERLKLENQFAIAEIQTKAQNMNERMAAVEDMMKQFHIQAHEVAMQAHQQDHQADMAQQQAEAQSQQSAQDAAQGQQAAQMQARQQEAQPEA